MVLLVPRIYNGIKNRGKAEGIVEGRTEEREAQQKRWKEAMERFGVEEDGVKKLPMTTEVEAFLSGYGD